jgi:hypothetical protein
MKSSMPLSLNLIHGNFLFKKRTNLIISQNNIYYQVMKNTAYIGVEERGVEINSVQKF